jgi:hypothetical protein
MWTTLSLDSILHFYYLLNYMVKMHSLLKCLILGCTCLVKLYQLEFSGLVLLKCTLPNLEYLITVCDWVIANSFGKLSKCAHLFGMGCEYVINQPECISLKHHKILIFDWWRGPWGRCIWPILFQSLRWALEFPRMLLSKLVCSEGVTTRGTIVSRRFMFIRKH